VENKDLYGRIGNMRGLETERIFGGRGEIHTLFTGTHFTHYVVSVGQEGVRRTLTRQDIKTGARAEEKNGRNGGKKGVLLSRWLSEKGIV